MLESYEFQRQKGQEAAELRAQIAKANLEKEKENNTESKADKILRFVAEEKERQRALRALEAHIAEHFDKKKVN